MGTESNRRKPPPIERRPLMLKDFLRDDLSSCSSNGFRSFPRRSYHTSVRNLLEMDLKATDSNNARKLLRNRSKAASTTISVFQKTSEAVINVVRYFPFSSLKSPKQGILPRSLSRRLKRSFWKKSDKEEHEIRVIVRVKDIIRWKSFRDLVQEKDKPLDCSSSPIHTITTTNTTTTTTTTTSKSNSWSDSDFTSDYLHSSSGSSDCSGENDADDGKKKLPNKKKSCNEVVEDSMNKAECPYEEKEQFSPVSVLDFAFEEDEETASSFQQSLANMERTKKKLMQKIRRFEGLAQLEPVDLEKRIVSLNLDDSLESPRDYNEEDEESIKSKEKARDLLKFIKETSSVEFSKATTVDILLLDFFRDEITESNLNQGAEGDEELLRVGRDWINGSYRALDWGVEESKEVLIREMERGGRWRKFGEEEKELALEMEVEVLDSLVEELLFDLLS